MTIKLTNYHQWAVLEPKFLSVVASFNTEQEALDYIEEHK
jgi:hypothetical protein